MEQSKRESKLLALLDTLPEELLIEHIRPHLGPESLVWLDRSGYANYHSAVAPLFRGRPCPRHPLGKWESYVRQMVRDDSAFVMQQLLRDNGYRWSRRRYYHYNHRRYPTYLHFIWDFCIEASAHRTRRRVLDAGTELIGTNWYKRRQGKPTRWSN